MKLITAEDLLQQASLHNQKSKIASISYFLISALLWLVSILAAYFVIGIILGAFKNIPPWLHPALVAGFILLLFFEAWSLMRRNKSVHRAYNVTGFSTGLSGTGGAYGINREVMKVAGPAYVVSQILYAAPTSLFKAWSHFHNRLELDPADAEEGAELMNRLTTGPVWRALEPEDAGNPALPVLDELGEVLFREYKDELQIRISRDRRPTT